MSNTNPAAPPPSSSPSADAHKALADAKDHVARAQSRKPKPSAPTFSYDSIDLAEVLATAGVL